LASVLTSSSSVTQAGTTWKLSFSDDFTRLNQSSWSVYGKGGPSGAHCYDSANVTVSGGQLKLKVAPSTKCKGYSAGGMCACAVTTQTYGKFEARMKATVGNSKITLLLWGAKDWPPEIDFAEFPADGLGMTRQRFNETLHYSSKNLMIHSHTDADMTNWHTVGVEWSPGKVVYTLDGRAKTTITQHVPSVDMWMGIQTAGSKTATLAYTYIDWVHVYKYLGG
jgi:beta-glucanase (GH16 family)